MLCWFCQYTCIKIRWAPFVHPGDRSEESTGVFSQMKTKLHGWAVWQARAGCYSQAALSSNHSKLLYLALFGKPAAKLLSRHFEPCQWCNRLAYNTLSYIAQKLRKRIRLHQTNLHHAQRNKGTSDKRRT